ncbi:TIGR02281 family clan AA aspartic protease [Glaciecola sp. XM2]|jgi:aspartyl protease family protein|uniref:retropepsin-like aspartic protease family protein n=1 Tax=Glaciecola sp. XM2 TaxID=1914931 RepID=UPI001BDF666E|nr:TIGR02281 family clan AA aspartic protease [Glaciecola sp. XM2]MBT1451490.1 TIGR02281 family clan AA aspartic protease [Glaciecola sp. XM2]
MFIGAFVVGFALLVMYFSGMLDRQYNPNQAPSSVVTASGVEVRLKQNTMGHYVLNGEINGNTVTFLLDTGATNVSIGAHLAQQLGLQPGRRYLAQTANGTVSVAQTNIRELKIGEITLQNVDANLNPGMRSDKILLGMSALKQLEWAQRGDELTLRTL